MADWDVNDTWSLKSITADRRLEWTGTRDADNTPLLILHTNYTSESDQFSQEFQAVRRHGSPRWRVRTSITSTRNPSTGCWCRWAIPAPRTTRSASRWITEAQAAFTEWTFKFTDAFSATAGIRYTKETKGLQAIMFNVAPATAPEPAAPTALCPFAGPPPTQTGCLFLTTNRFEREFSSTTKSASVQYRFNESVMTYLSWSEGFKSGGFNQRYNAAPPGNAPISFGAETAESFEFGLKLDPLGYAANQPRRLQHGLRRHPDDLPSGRRAAAVQCRCRLHRWRRTRAGVPPTEDFRLECHVGYLDAEVRQHHAAAAVRSRDSRRRRPRCPAACRSRRNGRDISECPTRFHPGSNWSLTPRVDVSYTDEQFFDAGNSPEIAQDEAVTLLNASLALESEDDKWRFVLGGNNLTDELYPVAGTSSLTTASGYAEIIYARPRSVSLSATRNF